MLVYVIILLTILFLLYESPTCKYYMKFIIFGLVIVIGALYYIVEFSIRGRQYKNAWRFKKVYKLAGILIGLNPCIKGKENLNPEEPCVFIANHQSLIDVASACDIWVERCTVIAKSSTKYWGPVGLIAWLCRVVHIERSNPQQAIHILADASKQAVKDRGTRSNEGKLLPFKKGAFHAAVQCQYPIQPVVISPYGAFLDHKKKRFAGAAYDVQVLPRISTIGKDTSNVNELLEETYEKMSACFESLRQSVIVH